MAVSLPRTTLAIDFGTSNSVGALFDGDRFDVVTDPNSGLFTVPSSLFVDGSGTVLVGAVADRLSRTDPRRYESGFKRTLAQPGTVSLGGWTATRIELVGRVLDFLREQANQRSHDRHRRAVLTVPAAYDDYRRSLMKQAGADAGLEVDLVAEPVAAAMGENGSSAATKT